MDRKIFGGRYEVLEKIGAGGMAIVYKAKDQLLNRVVTIKVLREQFVTDQDFIRRFRREAQSAASLSHPNIVSIYDVGKEGDIEYIVMEYVEGRNLKEIIREYAPLSVEHSINLARQIAEAVQNAHEHHIIHRDIKPHNILVTEVGRAKVTDFGIALAVSSATVTHADDIVGSVHYLSPEQAKGLPSNEQSDIYSLGIVLYELVTGKVPYDGETPITIALKHLQEEPVLPGKINPRVGRDFEAVIMRAIAKSLSQRYASAKDLLEDLNNLQAGRPIAEIPERPDDEEDDIEATQIHKGMSKGLSSTPTREGPSKTKTPGGKSVSKRKWRITKPQRLIALGVVALCVIFLVISGWKFYDYVNGETVKVPDVAGKSLEEAREIIERENLVFDESKVELKYDETVLEGLVIRQDPEAEKSVRSGREVVLTISQGPEKLLFPDVVTKSKEEAENLILEYGFDISKIEYKQMPNAIVAKGYVIAQDPEKNTAWLKGDPIVLTISEGESVQMYMPAVVDQEVTEAKNVLEGYGLTVKVELESSEEVATNMVISTKPKPGDPIVGTEVTIVISSGPTLGTVGQGIGDKVYMALLTGK